MQLWPCELVQEELQHHWGDYADSLPQSDTIDCWTAKHADNLLAGTGHSREAEIPWADQLGDG